MRMKRRMTLSVIAIIITHQKYHLLNRDYYTLNSVTCQV